jgi:hypothetical protein
MEAFFLIRQNKPNKHSLVILITIEKSRFCAAMAACPDLLGLYP